jgi:murein DD-endopeptidase MepM/ murein hydrolase activator NlpD
MRLGAALERRFPEKRLFLRSDTQTRFVRLSPATQILALGGSALIVGWAIMASAIILMDSLSAGSIREQAEREQRLYEERLNTLSEERDKRIAEAVAAQERFTVALDQVSEMQMRLLASDERRREYETGIEVIQATLRQTMKERDEARAEADLLRARLERDESEDERERIRGADAMGSLDLLAEALSATAAERDEMRDFASAAAEQIDAMEYEAQLAQERNERIFTQIEEAVAVSLEPLDDMFASAGLPTDSIIEQLRRTYSGQGGPLTPLTFSTKGEAPHPEGLRANEVLEKLDELNLYRIAAQKTPFAVPLKSAYRFTSGFGPRWGRMHNGTDFASAYGTPIYATADGVVVHAGWEGGFGRLIRIRHEFGIETYYAHLSKIHVNVGQRVSRGDRIGDMGNSGRSTGTHLHYEVRQSGKPVNPMTYIKAARDVF